MAALGFSSAALGKNPATRAIALDEAAETSIDLSQLDYIWQEEEAEERKTLKWTPFFGPRGAVS